MTQLRLDVQLVDLTPDEWIERSKALGLALRALDRLDIDQAQQRKDMKRERDESLQQIAALAEVVRSGREERPIGR